MNSKDEEDGEESEHNNNNREPHTDTWVTSSLSLSIRKHFQWSFLNVKRDHHHLHHLSPSPQRCLLHVTQIYNYIGTQTYDSWLGFKSSPSFLHTLSPISSWYLFLIPDSFTWCLFLSKKMDHHQISTKAVKKLTRRGKERMQIVCS